MPPTTRIAVLDQPAASREIWFFNEYAWASIRDPETPESLLLRAIEEEVAPPVDLADLDAWIDRLPLVEQDILHLVREGKPQWEIAEIFGVTQCSISIRLKRATERLRWIAGPGSWFSPDDMLRDEAILLRALEPQQVVYLRTLWEVGNYTQVGRQLGHYRTKHTRSKCLDAYYRLQRSTDPELGLYRRGFEELLSWGMGLLTQRGVPWSVQGRTGRRGRPPEAKAVIGSPVE